MGWIRTRVVRLVAVVIALNLTQLVLAQSAGSTWIQLNPTGGPPGQRLLPSAAYDPTTNRMLVFGGANEDYGTVCTNSGAACYNDVWVLANADGLGGTPAWSQLAPSGIPPAPRFGSGAGYDPGNNRLIIFGGGIVDNAVLVTACSGPVSAGYANDVWILTNANGSGGAPAWTPVTPVGVPPAARRSGATVYDAANNRLIMFGGQEPCGKLNDVWVLSNANGLGGTPAWTQLNISGPMPAARGEMAYAGAYDAANNRLIIFGGESELVDYNDVWVLSNANGLGGTPARTQLSPAAGPPSVRHAHAVTTDAAANTLIVIGGVNHSQTTFFGDVWRLSNANGLGGTPVWTQLNPQGSSPGPRAGQSAVYHQAARRATVFAGANCVPCSGLNDTWVLAESTVVPFSAFSSAVWINDESSGFAARGGFTPGPGGTVDPPTQTVTFRLGGFTATIPAGSFQANNGAFTFWGVINGVPFEMMIQPQGGGGYTFRVEAAGGSNLPTGNPVTVGLTIGNNTGSIQVNASFD